MVAYVMNVPLTPVRFLRHAEQQYPDNTAVVCGDKRFTYAQFAARVSRLAGALRECGIEPGERVAFLSLNCHRFLEAYYGVLEAGAVLLPLDIHLAPHELAHALNEAAAAILFLDPASVPLVDFFHKSVPTVRRFFALDGAKQTNWLSPENYEDLLASAQPYRADLLQFDENALAELFYTSGTTANPKGVMLTHRNIYLHALNVALAMRVTAQDAFLHTIPLFHANGWGVSHILTLMGGKHIMVRGFDPAEVLRLIARERASGCIVVPAMASALLQSSELHECELRSLDWVMIGSSASSPELVRDVQAKLRCDCYSGYGLTRSSAERRRPPRSPGDDWVCNSRRRDSRCG